MRWGRTKSARTSGPDAGIVPDREGWKPRWTSFRDFDVGKRHQASNTLPKTMNELQTIRRRLAHYELLGEIGRGGMGVVYQALDTRLRRKVAIKVLLAAVADATSRRARLLREAQAAAQFNHPSIATVYEIGEAHTEDRQLAGRSGDVVYIAMEYVEGRDLRHHLEEGLALHDVVSYGVQIAEGLASAHRAGVIHRDLKPSNVRITPEGRVKILDFGLAKVSWDEVDPAASAEIPLTKTGVILGTIPYMAPEQLEGSELDARADLFSLGVILYQLLTGYLPFDGARLVDYVRSLTSGASRSPSKSNPAIPARLGRLVERLLARHPEDRWSSATTVGAELQAIAQGDPGSVPTMSMKALRFEPGLKVCRWPWGGAMLSLMAILGGWAFHQARRIPPAAELVESKVAASSTARRVWRTTGLEGSNLCPMRRVEPRPSGDRTSVPSCGCAGRAESSPAE